MARPGVTEAEVFEAIERLVEIEAKVTVRSVQAELGKGSHNTINRHLQNWRTAQLKQSSDGRSDRSIQLSYKVKALEKDLKDQIKQNQHFSEKLLAQDRKNLQLEATLKAEIEKNTQLQHALSEAKAETQQVRALQEAVSAERQALLKPILEVQKNQVAQFQADLKAVNEASLQEVRSVGLAGQDRWLEEKIKVRDLKVDLEQLLIEHDTLKQSLERAQKLNEPLKQRIAKQDQLIATCLDPTKVAKMQQAQEKA